jgi:exodeoxyribonuclease (lambda-induced)
MPRQLEHEQRSPEWVKDHIGKITGSTAPGCLSVGPDGPLAAFNAITGITTREVNSYMRWGNDHEQHALEAYEVASGNLVRKTNMWLHDEYTWLGASPDGLIGHDGMVEVKCPQTLPTSIPEHHDLQMRIGLAVLGRDYCDYWAWTPDGTFAAIVLRDPLIEADLIQRLKRFYETYIVPNVAPPRRRPA